MTILVALLAFVVLSLLATLTLMAVMRRRSEQRRRETVDRWEAGLGATGKAESGGWTTRRRR
jgi:membrane protein implicated in regulation of membrane protease activity